MSEKLTEKLYTLLLLTVLTLSQPLSESAIAMPYVLNSETAKIAAQKSIEARRRYAAERKQAAMMLELQEKNKVVEAPVEQSKGPLENKFARALEDTLDQYLATDDATERAKIARALREVRETYHLWSGQPKPGTIKPERQSSRQQVKQPSEPKLDTPTGSVPTP